MLLTSDRESCCAVVWLLCVDGECRSLRSCDRFWKDFFFLRKTLLSLLEMLSRGTAGELEEEREEQKLEKMRGDEERSERDPDCGSSEY